MSELFNRIPRRFVAAKYAAMAAGPFNDCLILTKRPEEAARWYEWVSDEAGAGNEVAFCMEAARSYGFEAEPLVTAWPLPHVWLGVSAENQEWADKRIPTLLSIPAAVHWVSYEPALGPVDFTRWLGTNPGIDWIVAGGESGGTRARGFDLQWARDTISQCRSAGVPCFVKQVGTKPSDGEAVVAITDKKGGVPLDWPPDLRVREFPASRAMERPTHFKRARRT